MLVLQPVNDGLSLLLALRVLQVVHVKLVLQIVNVCVLFNIDAVVALKFRLKTLVLFLILRFDILNAL